MDVIKATSQQRSTIMQSTESQETRNNILSKIRKRLSLQDHIDTHAAVESIRAGQVFRGPNVFILAFAIIIASVGLNVNSIPVIIGAMLISPLMGPIVGIGLSMGINDYRLMKSSLTNLFTMVLISIVASTLYFILSPLKLENPTELLARTNPTLYDVLIALFGGLAGILEISRKEKGTVMSGVAIATALMPPLCTIGYGIASLNLHYAVGALYLFFINGVFIALAAFVGVKYLGYKAVANVDPLVDKKNRRRIGFAILVMVIPSIFSAIEVVRQNDFERNASDFVVAARTIGNNYIYDYKINHDNKLSVVELYLADKEVDSSDKETLYALAAEQGISRGQIQFNTNLASSSMRSDKLASEIIARKDKEITNKDSLIAQLNREIALQHSKQLPYKQLETEIKAQYPNLQEVIIANGMTGSGGQDSTQSIVIIHTQPNLSKEKQDQLQRWIVARTGISEAKIL